jgi:hypothetical protein
MMPFCVHTYVPPYLHMACDIILTKLNSNVTSPVDKLLLGKFCSCAGRCFLLFACNSVIIFVLFQILLFVLLLCIFLSLVPGIRRMQAVPMTEGSLT